VSLLQNPTQLLAALATQVTPILVFTITPATMSDAKLLPAELNVSELRLRMKTAASPAQSIIKCGPGLVRVADTHLLILKHASGGVVGASAGGQTAQRALGGAPADSSSTNAGTDASPPKVAQDTPPLPGDVLLKLGYDTISAVRLNQTTFGKATVFLEGGENAPYFYCFFELPNRFSHLLEDALEKNVSRYVRRQIVPEWLYGDYFANLPHMYYRRELRIVVNLSMLLVQAAVLVFLFSSIFRQIELVWSVPTTTGAPDPAAVAWVKRMFYLPAHNVFYNTLLPLARRHWFVAGVAMATTSIVAAPVLGLLIAGFIAWQMIFHGSVFIFHVMALKDMFQQAISGLVELRSLMGTARLWLSNFLLRGGTFARLLKIDPNKKKQE
jgi:hypothetical protein